MTEQLKPEFIMGGDGLYAGIDKDNAAEINFPCMLISLPNEGDFAKMRDVLENWSARADGWISAKNNPPPKFCQVIAEWSNGDIEQSSYITDWGKPHFQRKCGTDENGAGWTGNVGHVINWMPLPSPSAK